jgi:hypothetical protein
VAVAWLNTNTDAYAAGASSFSTAMSVTASGSNRCAVVHIQLQGAGGGSGQDISGNVTYAGTNMTSAGAALVDTQFNGATVHLYTLVNPATGSNTLAGTASVACNITVDLIAYTGVNQTTPVRASSYTTQDNGATSQTTCTITVPSQTGDMTNSCAGSASTSQALNSTNHTQRNIDNSIASSYGTDDAVASGNVTHTWTWAGAEAGKLCAGFSIAAAAAAGGISTAWWKA